MDYAQRIKSLRKERKIKQLDIIAKLEMHPTTYKRYESGEQKPPVDFIKNLLFLLLLKIDKKQKV